jgi:hypothetical protein
LELYDLLIQHGITEVIKADRIREQCIGLAIVTVTGKNNSNYNQDRRRRLGGPNSDGMIFLSLHEQRECY